jgi:hypothetical protein
VRENEVAEIESSWGEFVENIVYFKRYVYTSFVPELFKNDNFFTNIHTLKWDIKEISVSDPPNYYIDKLIMFINDQHSKLKALDDGCLPKKVQQAIMQEIVRYVLKQLVDSYSKVKKVPELTKHVY